MANIMLMKNFKSPDGSMVQRVHRFLEKLAADDTHPSLRVKPLENAVDDRVRTGRVNDDYRAVLVRLVGGDEATYVFLGALPHDEAIDYASRVRFRINPINGVPELEELMRPRSDAERAAARTQEHEQPAPTEPSAAEREAGAQVGAVPNKDATEVGTGASKTHYPIMGSLGYTAEWLEGLGVHA